MGDKVKIAGVQMDPVIEKVGQNLEKVLLETGKAAAGGADLIIFPECALTGYMFTSRAEALPFMETIPGPSTERLAKSCRELGVHLVVGMMERDGDRCYNVAVFIGPDGIIGNYRKNHLPYLGIDRYLDAGEEISRVHRTPLGNIGVNICYDCLFPESIRTLALQGADIVVLPTNWPAGRDKLPRYLVNTRALENRVHFVAVDRVGVERGAGFLGHSKIINALGDTLAEAGGDTEETIYAEVDLAEARQKHVVFKPGEFEIDLVRHRRPELYGEITKKIT